MVWFSGQVLALPGPQVPWLSEEGQVELFAFGSERGLPYCVHDILLNPKLFHPSILYSFSLSVIKMEMGFFPQVDPSNPWVSGLLPAYLDKILIIMHPWGIGLTAAIFCKRSLQYHRKSHGHLSLGTHRVACSRVAVLVNPCRKLA